MARKLNADELRRVAEDLLGTSQSVEGCLDSLGYAADPEQVESRMPDYGVERCIGCDWWCEIDELNGDNLCDSCGET